MLLLLVAHLIVSVVMFLKDKYPAPSPIGELADILETSPVSEIDGKVIPWAISVFVCFILLLLVLFMVEYKN